MNFLCQHRLLLHDRFCLFQHTLISLKIFQYEHQLTLVNNLLLCQLGLQTFNVILQNAD
jgi:hypothetical protein